jgi:hypothetical protein
MWKRKVLKRDTKKGDKNGKVKWNKESFKWLSRGASPTVNLKLRTHSRPLEETRRNSLRCFQQHSIFRDLYAYLLIFTPLEVVGLLACYK